MIIFFGRAYPILHEPFTSHCFFFHSKVISFRKDSELGGPPKKTTLRQCQRCRHAKHTHTHTHNKVAFLTIFSRYERNDSMFKQQISNFFFMWQKKLRNSTNKPLPKISFKAPTAPGICSSAFFFFQRAYAWCEAMVSLGVGFRRTSQQLDGSQFPEDEDPTNVGIQQFQMDACR